MSSMGKGSVTYSFLHLQSLALTTHTQLESTEWMEEVGKGEELAFP